MGFLSNAIRDVAQKKYLRQWEDYAFRKERYENQIEIFKLEFETAKVRGQYHQGEDDFSPKRLLLSAVNMIPTEYQDEFLAYFRAEVGEIDF